MENNMTSPLKYVTINRYQAENAGNKVSKILWCFLDSFPLSHIQSQECSKIKFFLLFVQWKTSTFDVVTLPVTSWQFDHRTTVRLSKRTLLLTKTNQVVMSSHQSKQSQTQTVCLVWLTVWLMKTHVLGCFWQRFFRFVICMPTRWHHTAIAIHGTCLGECCMDRSLFYSKCRLFGVLSPSLNYLP